MQISSLQIAASKQRRVLDRLWRSYSIKQEDDPVLENFQRLTQPYRLRNYATREKLCYELAELRGHRTHYLVWSGQGCVTIYTLQANIDPMMVKKRNPDPVVRARERALSDPLGQRVRDFKAFLLKGSSAG